MHEKISALIDNELGHDSGSAVREVCADPELTAAWQRYHLIGAVLRNETSDGEVDLSARVLQRLARDPSFDTAPEKPKARMLPIFPRLAIAASIAGAVAIGFYITQQVEPTQVATEDTAPVAAVQVAATDEPTKWDTSVPGLEETLNGFLVEHGEFTPAPGMNGLMAYAKFVSYDVSD